MADFDIKEIRTYRANSLGFLYNRYGKHSGINNMPIISNNHSHIPHNQNEFDEIIIYFPDKIIFIEFIGITTHLDLFYKKINNITRHIHRHRFQANYIITEIVLNVPHKKKIKEKKPDKLNRLLN